MLTCAYRVLERGAGLQVDQGVVLLGVHYMKGGVTRGLLTKDVRSPDGWQIGIDVFDHVQVRFMCYFYESRLFSYCYNTRVPGRSGRPSYHFVDHGCW